MDKPNAPAAYPAEEPAFSPYEKANTGKDPGRAEAGDDNVLPGAPMNEKTVTQPTSGSDSGLAPRAPERAAEPPVSLFSLAALTVALPNMLIPTLYGYNIGVVGVYSTMYSFATNCELYLAKKPCETLSGVKCKWYNAPAMSFAPAATVCGWADTTTCYRTYNDETGCRADSACVWNYKKKTCGNAVGYESIYSGLFAGSMIIGAMTGSLVGGVLTKKLGYRLSFFLVGVISVIASIMTHVTTGIFEYWLLFVARIVLGFAMGWQAIAAPSYTDVFSPPNLQKMLGTFFQVFTAFGSFLAAVVGIALGNTIAYSANRDANLMGRMQGFVCVSTFMAILVLFLPLVTRAQPSKSNEDGDNGAARGDEAVGTGADMKKYSCLQMLGPVTMGIIMGCTLQLTGINAVMNYAPTMMVNLGLEPLVGNVIVMAWNSITAFGVIPLSKRFTMRTLFLFCTLGGSLACLFLCGIPVYPGVASESVKNGVAITGIVLFILAYECGIGPCFFVLAVDLFPASFRPIGSSITTAVMFSLNLVINICYPIATEGISGGPSGEQDKGQAVAFIFFGCVGLVTLAVEYFFLHPWDSIASNAAHEELTDALDVSETPLALRAK